MDYFCSVTKYSAVAWAYDALDDEAVGDYASRSRRPRSRTARARPSRWRRPPAARRLEAEPTFAASDADLARGRERVLVIGRACRHGRLHESPARDRCRAARSGRDRS
jgi:hypothetical protein